MHSDHKGSASIPKKSIPWHATHVPTPRPTLRSHHTSLSYAGLQWPGWVWEGGDPGPLRGQQWPHTCHQPFPQIALGSRLPERPPSAHPGPAQLPALPPLHGLTWGHHDHATLAVYAHRSPIVGACPGPDGGCEAAVHIMQLPTAAGAMHYHDSFNVVMQPAALASPWEGSGSTLGTYSRHIAHHHLWCPWRNAPPGLWWRLRTSST